MSKTPSSKYIVEFDNVQIHIGEIMGADDSKMKLLDPAQSKSSHPRKAILKEEKTQTIEGPTSMPGLTGLRVWDHRLLARYSPVYTPTSDTCEYCTYGKCDLTGNKEGACGIDLATQQSREALKTAVMGAACHSAHGRHLLDYFIKKYGREHPIDVGQSNLKAPLTSTITGIEPKTIGDFLRPIEYVEEQLVQLMAVLNTGQEGSNIDFESKSLHAGMLDHLGMEICDIVQMSCMNYPKSEMNTPIVEIGMGILDEKKPVVICIGHNAAAPAYILDYMEKKDLFDKIEIAGICCTAHDITRYNRNAKIIGSMSKQLKYIRSGIPDVLVVDEQCVRADILKEASKLKMPVIATNEKITLGLPDMTMEDVDVIVEKLSGGEYPGAFILDYDKVGEVVPRLALAVSPERRAKLMTALPSEEELQSLVKKCTDCGVCTRDCPISLPIAEAMKAGALLDFSKFEALHDKCIGCGRCDFSCPVDIPILNTIEKAAQKVIRKEKGKIRIGRGQIADAEIRTEGVNLVLGTTPGVLAFVGCGNYPNGTKEIYDITVEMLKRNYIVLASGCAAMDIAMYKDDEGKTLFERFPGRFARGNLINTGPCVSNAHIAGTTIKVAAIFAGKKTSGNYEEIADYILTRVGAVGLAWGAYSQKAFAIGTGCNRLGIPVVIGPHGSKYRRVYLGRNYRKKDWKVFDARDGSVVDIEPAPEHLMITCQTKEEVLPMLAKLCIRPSDNNFGRAIKLSNYIELSEKYLGKMPDDWQVYVRSEGDLPIAMREKLLKQLEEVHGWKIDWEKKKIMEGPLRKPDVSFQPTNVPRLCKEVKK
ncbi:MAG: CO dehydrogenase/acetyl-CoA synthase complex subunit alpha [Candidatus Methanoperedens sp.]|nr:CO dehydrogenase/acetyl-CoA synthase complex subunit alpha [Candidatus Methanoperedens sp.]